MAKVQIYNTESRKIQEIDPVSDDGVLRVYCCGPTVYNYPHIGNMRAYIWQDVMVKTLRYAGYNVKHVMNITDVGHLTSDEDTGEDKMRVASEREKMSVYDIARKYENIFFDYSKQLNIKRPDVVCRATEYIGAMIELVKLLEAKGYAYLSGGNVYFDTSKFPNYGKMAGLDLNNLEHGSRVEEDTNKKNPTDFVLWFTESKFKNQILVWPSPWGEAGYPGWHLECSAMAIKELGEYLDIHCGGVDHVGVHHTNEIAQSEAMLGHKWTNIWAHGEFLNFAGAKMSKSSGGFITLDSIKEQGIEPMHYRYLCLTASYRSTLEFSDDSLIAAKNSYENLKTRVIELKKNSDGSADKQKASSYIEKFYAHLYNDFATSQALATMWEMLKDNEMDAATKLYAVSEMDVVLSLGVLDMQPQSIEITTEIQSILDRRKAARASKDWEMSDMLRDELKDKFLLEIKDLSGGEIELKKL